MKVIRIYENETKFLAGSPKLIFITDLYNFGQEGLTIYRYFENSLNRDFIPKAPGLIIQIELQAEGRIIPEPLIFW